MSQPGTPSVPVFSGGVRRARVSGGFTLTEMLIAVVILGIAASALIPDSTPREDLRLGVALGEVENALVFARGEALRTAQPHGVRFRTTLDKVEVFRLDLSGPSPVEVYDVRHPLDKKPYDIDLDDFPYTAGATASANFRYEISGTPSLAVAFDARGEPVAANDLDPAIQDGVVTVVLGPRSRTVTVEQLTGRIVASD